MTLTEIGIKHGTDKANYHGFTDFYEQELKGREIRTILEIGILNGSSLRMWKEYYPDAIVIGIDVQEPLEIPNVICLKGDATDTDWIQKQLGGIKFDLIIDDGSHKTEDQILTFYWLFNFMLKENGIYICEDVHTSFREYYINSDKTAVEYLMDQAGLLADVKFWWKDENDKTDSGTCIIHKKPWAPLHIDLINVPDDAYQQPPDISQ